MKVQYHQILHHFTLKALLATILTFAAAQMAGQETAPYFCNKANTVLEYTRTNTDGSIKWYHTMAIKQMVGGKNGTTANYTSYIQTPKHKPYYGKSPAELTATITNNGVTLNVAESVAAIFRTIFPDNIKITSTGGESTLPSNITPGDTLPNVNASVKVLVFLLQLLPLSFQVPLLMRLRWGGCLLGLCLMVGWILLLLR